MNAGQQMWITVAAVAVGGAIGSVARHGVNLAFAHLLARQVPLATATVNIAGSAAIGVLAGAVASGRISMSPSMRTFVFVGCLGGFTTFSSFMLDTLTLGHAGARASAAVNVAGQNLLGILAVYLGYQLGSR